MGKRFQRGSVTKYRTYWVGRWWENGHRRNKVLGKVSQMTKSQAREKLLEHLRELNLGEPSADWPFQDFVDQVYLPFYGKKWKASTSQSNKYRVKTHLVDCFGERTLASFTRDELQALLDRKAELLSFDTVAHLRWDLKQIFHLAQMDGYLKYNPAAMLFVPRDARRPQRRRMTLDQARLLTSALDFREQIICSLALLAGLRPGEIFSLQWHHIQGDRISIKQRIYRGQIDSPKTAYSDREVAIPPGLQQLLRQWKAQAIPTDLPGWVFPSERLSTPVSKDNCWRRHILPKLEKLGLDWANFQVMRRTHSSLMRDLGVDPKVVAEQQGHSLDVNLNVYTQTGMRLKLDAVRQLEEHLANGPTMDQHADRASCK